MVRYRRVQVRADQRREFQRIALVGLNRGLQHVGVGHIFPCDVIAGVAGEVADKLALRPAVAFAEGVQRIQLTEIVRGPLAPLGAVANSNELSGLTASSFTNLTSSNIQYKAISQHLSLQAKSGPQCLYGSMRRPGLPL